MPGIRDEKIREREIEFAKSAIAKAPKNQCPWNYLRGIVKRTGLPLSSLKEFVNLYASVEDPDRIQSSHALDLLADILAENEQSRQQAALALDMLAQKYDPIRKNFWEYRKGMLGLQSVSV